MSPSEQLRLSFIKRTASCRAACRERIPILLHKFHTTMSQTRAGTVELQDLDTYPRTSVLHNKASTQQLTENGRPERQTLGEEASLPRVDGGKEAWSFLAACWFVEAMTFGEILPFSAGVQLHLS